jgi:hypothetical protein
VGRARYVVALVIGLLLTGAPRTLGPAPPATAAPLRMVAAGGVTAYVPPGWEVRPIRHPGSDLVGLKASRDLERWVPNLGKGQGVTAYWVDATRVRVPSDYYVLAARGPALESLPGDQRCRSDGNNVVLGQGRSHEALPSGFLATARGSCQTAVGGIRWAAFVAAPGFGPLREIGIPESGMYFALASIPQGPGDDRMLDRMLAGVSFGETNVSEFLQAAKARMI